MELLELIKLIQESNKETKEEFAKRFDDYNKSITLLFTSETNDIKEQIKGLKDQVSIQNGSVRTLKEWRVGVDKDLGVFKDHMVDACEDAKERKKSSFNWFTFIISQIIVVVIFILSLIYVYDKEPVVEPVQQPIEMESTK